MGDAVSGPIRLTFNPQLRVEFRGATVTSDAGRQRASAALADILALTPGFDLAQAASQNVYQRDDDRARFIDGLRKAGLPE